MAAVFWASFRRRAMVWRRRVILTRSSRSWTGRGADGAAATAGAAARASRAARASPLVTRPSLPDPATVLVSRPVSAAMRRTDGATGAAAATAAGAAAGTGAATGAGARAEGLAAAPAVTRPSSAPGRTVSPSAATISVRTPSAGETTSRLTLSVSSSINISSRLTASPTFLVQRATVASATDSPRAGVMMSAIGLSTPVKTAGRGRVPRAGLA